MNILWLFARLACAIVVLVLCILTVLHIFDLLLKTIKEALVGIRSARLRRCNGRGRCRRSGWCSRLLRCCRSLRGSCPILCACLHLIGCRRRRSTGSSWLCRSSLRRSRSWGFLLRLFRCERIGSFLHCAARLELQVICPLVIEKRRTSFSHRLSRARARPQT